MTLAAGTRIGAYEIHSALGAGGMGEVYRARDSKLGRDVALKILPDDFVSDPERRARFEREAQVLASLNHPNIAAIYGFEDSGATKALVLELVEGSTLADRIGESKDSPLPDTLSIARQIAEALEAAHERGIVHRDLKPANVKVRPDGTVKVLDFGLAAVAPGPTARDVNATHSPTLTLAATRGGMILGTAAYMSPEQASGKPVDKRADVWAFGVVLWEMLTGRSLFEGETVSHTLAYVITKEPDWTTLPASTPEPIRRLLKRCLEKDPKRRLPEIGSARLEIDEALAGAPSGGAAVSEGVAAGAAKAARYEPIWRRALPWGVATVALAGAIVMLAFWAPWRTSPQSKPVRVTADLGADVSFAMTGPPGGDLALSPNGEVLVFAARRVSGGTATQLYIRRLDQLQATPLAGTEDGRYPFFKPDGQWIGFFAGGKLKKISVTGGAAATVSDANTLRGGWWGDDGTIVFTPNGAPGTALMRVPESGGKPEPLIKLVEGEASQRWAQLLPGSKAVLFSSSATAGNWDDANIVVQTLPDGPRRIVQRGGFHGRYVSSGHLLYVHGGTLFAMPFDVNRLEAAGEAVPVIEGLSANIGTAGAQLAMSNNGTLVYLAGRTAGNAVPVAWVDRDGKSSPLRATPSEWSDPRFSPDGSRLAMDIAPGGGGFPAVWVYDWARDTPTRLTFSGRFDIKPVWTPDGGRIVFSTTGGNNSAGANLFWQRADGTGEVQRLTESPKIQFAGSWHPSGKFLAFQETDSQSQQDIMILPMEGDEKSGWKPGKPTEFLKTPFAEQEPRFSPDGRWLVYMSNESGQAEIYVRPFPKSVGKWQLSTGGGIFPSWSAARQEIVYVSLDQQLMVVPYTVDGDSFRAEKPRVWSPVRFVFRARITSYDLHPDGNRIAMAPPSDPQAAGAQDKVVFLFNFFDELKRLAPVSKPHQN